MDEPKEKEYTESQLFQMMKIIGATDKYGSIRSSRWDNVRSLVECINSKKEKTQILEKSWGDSSKAAYPQLYPLDLKKLDTWSTYDDEDCIHLDFFLDKNVLMCDVTIKEGSSFSSFHTSTKFKALLKLPNSYILNLKYRIESKFEEHCEHAYYANEAKKQKKWIDKYKLTVLDETPITGDMDVL